MLEPSQVVVVGLIAAGPTARSHRRIFLAFQQFFLALEELTLLLLAVQHVFIVDSESFNLILVERVDGI